MGGQVGEEANVVRQLSTGAAHDRQLQPDREQLPVAAAGSHFALPAVLVVEQLLQVEKLLAQIIAAADIQNVVANGVLLSPPGDHGVGLIDGEDIQRRSEDENTLAGGLEHGRCQLCLLVLVLACADVAAGAYHAQHTPVSGTLHCAPAVLYPQPVPAAVAHPVLHAVGSGLAFHVSNQRAAHHGDIRRVHQWAQILAHAGDVFVRHAEQRVEARVVHLVGGQVPVPQAQLAGLHGQGQLGFTGLQIVGGLFQLSSALVYPFFQIVVAVAQGLLRAAALAYLAGQLLVQFFSVLVGVAEVAQQCFVAQVGDQGVAHGPMNQRSGQQDKAEHHGAGLRPDQAAGRAIGQQPDHRRQPGGQHERGKGAVARSVEYADTDADAAGDTVHLRLQDKVVDGRQGDMYPAQTQAGGEVTQVKKQAPATLQALSGRRLPVASYQGLASQRQQAEQADPEQQAGT